jgi:folate-binding protein YgfZ
MRGGALSASVPEARLSPLNALHAAAGAESQPYGDLLIVNTFGQPEAEYAAIRKSAAIMDWAHRGILELTGPDRLSFLNNLLTNQTYDKQTKASLPPHTGVYSFLLTNKGRIVTDLNVLELGDRTLLEMESRLVEPVRQMLDKYLFSEQVKLISRRGSLHELFITGPRALEALNRSLQAPVDTPTPLCSVSGVLAEQAVTIFRDEVCGVPGYVLICQAAAAEAIWRHFTAEGSGFRVQGSGNTTSSLNPEPRTLNPLARPIGWAAFNATRIEAGRPLFGIDIDDSVLPAETGQLARAVSFTKGCYLGQEIVARMHACGQLARLLVGIRMEGDALPVAGSKIYDDNDNEIGGITSSTVSPVLSNAAICLGYVKRPFFAVGTKLRIPAEGAMRPAVVVELPFVRG